MDGRKYKLRITFVDRSVLDFAANEKQVVKELYSDQDDPNVYYNTPSELRAFMQQVVDGVITYAKKTAKELEAAEQSKGTLIKLK